MAVDVLQILGVMIAQQQQPPPQPPPPLLPPPPQQPQQSPHVANYAETNTQKQPVIA